MYSIEIMVEEHENIRRMVKVVRKACQIIMDKGEVAFDDFEQMVAFIREYADQYHHGKEEQILFAKMKTELGRMGENLITHGMLVEHDYGRLYMHDLREALQRVKDGDEDSKLDVIANAISYTHLIERHIQKENDIVYPFGEKQLEEASFAQVEEETKVFEQNQDMIAIREKQLAVLEQLEAKYCS